MKNSFWYFITLFCLIGIFSHDLFASINSCDTIIQKREVEEDIFRKRYLENIEKINSLTESKREGLVESLHREDYLLKDTHSFAFSLVKNTHDTIVNNPFDDKIVEGLKKYFNIDLSRHVLNYDSKIVFLNISNILKRAENTEYSCSKDKKSFYCPKGVAAITTPFKHVIHLCDLYFKTLGFEHQAATLIHEWFHAWGGNKINYWPEKYCYQLKKVTKTEILLRNSDQYMLFIYYVGTNGKSLKCF